jgi:chromosome segregation ATPase
MSGCTCTAELAVLELATENAELRLQLGEVQEELIEMAVDAGDLNAEIEALRALLDEACDQRDAWKAEAERFHSPARSAAR